MSDSTVKVTMNLTKRDVDNTQKVKKSLNARTNASAVSGALAVTAKLINLTQAGDEILIRNKKGELERLVFANLD